MVEVDDHNGNGNGHNGNGNGNGKGKKRRPSSAGRDHPTMVTSSDRKLQAIQWWLEGRRPMDIARELGVTAYAVNGWLRVQRLNVLQETREHFSNQFALLLDDALSTVQTTTALLGDEEFLRNADPERLAAVAQANGTLFDKCLILFAGLHRGSEPKQSESLRIVSGSDDDNRFDGSDRSAESLLSAATDKEPGGEV